MTGQCGLISGPAATYTISGLDSIRDFAQDAVLQVQNISESIRSLIDGLSPVDVDIDLENAGQLSGAFQIDPPEYFETPGFVERSPSYNPSVNLPNFSKTVTAPADFTKSPPALDFGPRPSALSAEAPTNIPEIGDYAFPLDPTEEIPALPTLQPISIPALPTLTLPEFSAAEPDDPTISSVGNFSWSEATYTPTVRTETVAQIKAILGGSTGIPDSIWDMIESRARRQLRATARQAREEAVDYWASRGHFLTNGQLRKRTKEAADVEREGVSDLVRELVIQDARIYVERLNNALAQGIAQEGQLIGLHNAQADRSLRAAQIVFEIELQIANYKIQLYNAKMAAYLQKAQVFEVQMRGELSKLEKTKVELEAQRIVGQLNQQKLEAFRAQVQGVVATYDLFAKQVDAVVAKYDADRQRVTAFAEQVRAYSAQVAAKETEWRAYAESIRGEVAKLDAFKVEADVFQTRVQAYATGVQADKTAFDAESERERLKISWFDSRLREMSAFIEQERARIDADIRTNELNARQYATNASVEESRVRSDAQRLDVLARNADMRMRAQIQETQLKIQEARNIIEAQTTLVNSILAAQSQIAASALAALNYSASIQDSIQNSTSCSTTYDF